MIFTYMTRTHILCGGAALALMLSGAAGAAEMLAATPPGITQQPLGAAQGYNMETRVVAIPRDEVAFADLKGKTLYTYDNDIAGKPTCVEACAKLWLPALAEVTAKPFGDWSLVQRADGARQWTLKGKPLYTFTRDDLPGASYGNSPKQARRGRGRGGEAAPKDEEAVDFKPWHAALAFPITGFSVPMGIAVREVRDASGLALVEANNRTLYTFDGDLNRDKAKCAKAACESPWLPLVAPSLAIPIGDFAAISREDGVHQWTYKGKGLYTYAGDLWTADAYGIGVDKRFQVAQVVRYAKPDAVVFHRARTLGTVLATPQGMTLYKRDGFAWQSGGGHSFRHGVPLRPAVGRDMGTKAGCGAECLKTWHPYLAGPDAQPSGYWDIAVRDDGSRQWVYQGSTLWTFAGDKKPGDLNGNDTYDLSLSSDPTKDNDVGTPMMGAAALFWWVAVP